MLSQRSGHWLGLVGLLPVVIGACAQRHDRESVRSGAVRDVPVVARAYPDIADQVRVSVDVPQVEQARALVSGSPHHAGHHLTLGLAYFRDKRYPDAARSFKTGLRLDPRSWQGYRYLGYSLMGCGRLADAAVAFNRIHRMTVDKTVRSNAYLEQANCYWDMQHYDQAEAYYKQSLSMNSKQGFADLSLGVLEAQRGHALRARTHFLRASSTLTDVKLRASAYALLGRLNDERGDRRAAEVAYKQALELDPENATATAGLGTAR